jgi:hypothetical protein
MGLVGYHGFVLSGGKRFSVCNTSRLPPGPCLPVIKYPGHEASLPYMVLWHEQGLTHSYIYLPGDVHP